jgi:hypothetical protein
MGSHRLALGLGAGGLVLYWARLRARVLTWGATPDEAVTRLPGDELLEDADGMATRAIENLLGLNMHSVNRVLPEFQHPQAGDTIALGRNRMRLELIKPERRRTARAGHQ